MSEKEARKKSIIDEILICLARIEMNDELRYISPECTAIKTKIYTIAELYR